MTKGSPASSTLLVHVLHGPNLQMLGQREPEVYGSTTLPEINERLEAEAQELGVRLETFQSNHEGELLDRLASLVGVADGVLINPAG